MLPTQKLQNEPALVNQSAEDEAWFIKGDVSLFQLEKTTT